MGVFWGLFDPFFEGKKHKKLKNRSFLCNFQIKNNPLKSIYWWKVLKNTTFFLKNFEHGFSKQWYN